MIDAQAGRRPTSPLLRFDHGPGSAAIDIELLEAIRAELAELRRRRDRRRPHRDRLGPSRPASTSSRILDGGAGYIERFMPALSGAFEDCFALPPARGGRRQRPRHRRRLHPGLLHRPPASWPTGGGRIGVPELLLGVPFPAMALAAVRYATGDVGVADLVYPAPPILPAEALRRGLVDEVVARRRAARAGHRQGRAAGGAGRPARLLPTRSDRCGTGSGPELESTGRQRDARDAGRVESRRQRTAARCGRLRPLLTVGLVAKKSRRGRPQAPRSPFAPWDRRELPGLFTGGGVGPAGGPLQVDRDAPLRGARRLGGHRARARREDRCSAGTATTTPGTPSCGTSGCPSCGR